MEEKKFGKYYDIIVERAKDKPKLSLAQLHEELQGAHTLERYWERVDAEKAKK